MRQRTRAKREVHAVLMRTLNGRPPMSDAFGRGGRVWLAELELPADERETVDGCLRQIDSSTPRSRSSNAASPSRVAL